MWVGESHYSPSSFMSEALSQGVSKRVSAIPQGLKAGDPIALAHPGAIRTFRDDLGNEVGTHCDRCWGVPAAKAVGNHGVATLRRMVKDYARALQADDGITQEVAERYRLVRELIAAHDGGSGATHDAQVEAFLRTLLAYGKPEQVAGVFGLFRMRAIECVLPASQAADPAIQATCQERGVEIVSVPDDDPDHVVPGWKLPAFLREKPQADLPLVADDPETDAALAIADAVLP